MDVTCSQMEVLSHSSWAMILLGTQVYGAREMVEMILPPEKAFQLLARLDVVSRRRGE